MVGILFVLPVLSQLLPSSMDAIQKYLPSNAGQAIITGGSTNGQTGRCRPGSGWVCSSSTPSSPFGAAAFTLVRRDA